MKRFWKGYGSSAADLVKRIPVVQEKPPIEFIIYRHRLYRSLVFGMIFAALLPSIVAIDIFRNSILDLPFVADLMQRVSYFKSLCTVPKITEVFKLWYLVMYAFCVTFLLYAVVFYPYRTLIVMCRRIPTIKDHLFGIGICLLFSVLIYKLMTNPPISCEEGKLILGHANLILHSMTTTYIGMSIFGPLLWGMSVLIWTSTIFMIMLMVVRCLTRN